MRKGGFLVFRVGKMKIFVIPGEENEVFVIPGEENEDFRIPG